MALHHAKAGEVVDLRTLGASLKDANSVAIIKSDRFEAIHLVVPAGKDIGPNEVAGDITLYCLEGRISLTAAGSSADLSAGQWVYIAAGDPHSLTGVEDSALLMMIVFQ